MSRLLTIGILNQGVDLAKKMTKEYVDYVTLMGGTVNSDTIYNIYKNEYLTDPEKDKLTDWYDFRAGIKFSTGSIIANLYSLIPPYRTNGSTNGTPTLISGDRINQGALFGISHNYMNAHINTRFLRIVTKMRIIDPTANTNYAFIMFGEDNSAATLQMRFNTTGNRRRSTYSVIVNGVRTASDNSPAINLTSGTYIFEQSVNLSDRTHKIKTLNTSDYDRTIALPAGTLNGIYPFAAANTRLFGFSFNELFYHKSYYLL